MVTRPWKIVRLFVIGVMVGGVACSGTDNGRDAAGAPKAEAPKEKYPEPRFPSYLRPRKTVEEYMPAARALVRNKSGFQGNGMGILEPNDTVLLVPTVGSESMAIDAITRALKERKITPDVKYNYELVGVTKADAERLSDARPRRSADQGYFGAAQWIESVFADPAKAKAWMKERNPKLHDTLFPKERDIDPSLTPIQAKLRTVGEGIKAYLTAHPKIKGVFWGRGGSTGLRRAMYPMQEKFLGTFTADNRFDLLGGMSSYPGDVWRLAEEQMLEPLVYVNRIEATDPEGTNVWSDLTPDMAERWSQGAYQRGHLYMFPNQATGRFGYSFVNYPAFEQKWLPRDPIARLNGVIAGTGTGSAYWPRWEIHYKDGFITEVKGGGAYGDAFREFLTYPGIRELTFPFHKEPGYWYLYEIAFGSHPKAFRGPVGDLGGEGTGMERVRSGVIHWGQGIRVWHDPDAPTMSKTWMDFTAKHNVPNDHGWHTYTHFTTYKVKLRNAEKWVTLLDKGRMTSLDNLEVRALASRYGDPDLLLAEDWIPDVPGINAPGDYMRDYAPNPYAYVKTVTDKIVNGTYEHFYPPAGTPTSTTAAAKPAGTAGKADR